MSTREMMLGFAREAILTRAKADGYQPDQYDPESDIEGYVVSLLNALHHWCHACGHDWTAELNHAQALFEEDLREEFAISQSR
jgi:hypothetical protein